MTLFLSVGTSPTTPSEEFSNGSHSSSIGFLERHYYRYNYRCGRIFYLLSVYMKNRELCSGHTDSYT